jgi:hypothetical protein
MKMLLNPFWASPAASQRVSFGANLGGFTNSTSVAYAGELDSNQQTNDTGFNVLVDQIDLLEIITNDGAAQYRCGLYTNNAGAPDALMGSSDLKTGVAVGTNTLTFSTPVAVLAGQTFWLAWLTSRLLQGGLPAANAMRYRAQAGLTMPSTYGSVSTFSGQAKCRIWGNTY